MFIELAALFAEWIRAWGAWGVVALLLGGVAFTFARGFVHWAAACNLRIAFLESENNELRVDRAYWKEEALADRRTLTGAVSVAEQVVTP